MLRAGLLALCCALPPVAGAADRDEAMLRCRALTAAEARLSCYDAIVVAPSAGVAAGVSAQATVPPGRSTWSGRNGTEDFDFTARAGDQLLIDHDDAILVGRLKDATGKVLDNLHLAGRGSLRVDLPTAGDYGVSLSATGRWTARLQRAP